MYVSTSTLSPIVRSDPWCGRSKLPAPSTGCASARSRTAACGGHGPRWGHGCALPWGRARSSGYAWPPGDCYPAARCQVPRPARRFLYDAGSSPRRATVAFLRPRVRPTGPCLDGERPRAKCTVFSSSVWTALSATTSSPYVLCYKTAANGIRGERRRCSGEMTNQAKRQVLCENAYLHAD
jgi:hypothetical protein